MHHCLFGLSLEDLIPNLAGQYAPYIAKQLRNFQSGARAQQIISAMATTSNDAELIDMAAYFASQKKMQGSGKGENPVAKNLFLKGDASRSIPPCMSCHGVNGNGPPISRLSGDRRSAQGVPACPLIHWRSGERSNSMDGVMNK